MAKYEGPIDIGMPFVLNPGDLANQQRIQVSRLRTTEEGIHQVAFKHWIPPVGDRPGEYKTVGRLTFIEEDEFRKLVQF